MSEPMLEPTKELEFVIGISLTLFSGHEDVVRSLIRLGAKVDAETSSKRSAIYSAVSAGKSFSYLHCNDFRFIRFFPNIFAGHEKVVRALIEHGATVNVEDINKVTPLHVAAYRGKLFMN